MYDFPEVFHFFGKMEDPENEFGQCVNSVIFSAHSASVFPYLSAYCERFGKVAFIVGQKYLYNGRKK